MSEPKLALVRLGKLRRVARLVLHGPRAVMFPDDSKGLKFWLEPVIWLKRHLPSPKRSESLIVYSVPSCLERNMTNPVLLRRAKWDSGTDRALCKTEAPDWPSVVTTFDTLTAGDIAPADKLFRNLDESLSFFPFPVEGLDLDDGVGLQPCVGNHPIIAETVHREICRATRFSYFELHWTPVEAELTQLDRSWLSLFDALLALGKLARPTKSTSIVEKYDIDPRVLNVVLQQE